MGALRPAEPAPRRQNTIHRRSRSVEQRGHHLGGFHEPLRTQRVTSPRSVSLSCPVDGPRRRYNVDRETSRAAHAGFTPTCLPALGRLQEFVPSSRLIPSSPATFPCTSDDQVILPELILEPCVSPLQLAYLLIQRISLRLAAAFLRQGLQRPAMRRLAPRRHATSTGPLAAGLHLAGLGAPARFFDDPQLVRRTE